jgi:hypothetical protein
MNTTPRSRRQNQNRPPKTPQNLHLSQESEQFAEMPDPREIVEHLSIPGFVRRAPRRFHLDELTRFGDKVARVAESMQISYLTTIDSSLGVVRVFPVPLMIKVYSIMAQQFHWAPWQEPLEIGAGGPAQLLKANERARRNLEAAACGSASAMPAHVAEAMQITMAWLDSEAGRLRADTGTEGAPGTEAAPLRVV